MQSFIFLVKLTCIHLLSDLNGACGVFFLETLCVSVAMAAVTILAVGS